jgi:wyosine [tRNA(Phe)-imidazoG37] synthetase (radical SAM superfamily)
MALRPVWTYRMHVTVAPHALAFGPIVSRRFGRSLGINNIRPKRCSYACVYCQVGPTPRTETLRQRFFSPDEIFDAVAVKVAECRRAGERIDVISFVPDGEPTLDANLGESILAVRQMGLPVAVITNGSLLWVEAVRRDVALADIVSIEIDTVDDRVWKRLNRPSPALSLPAVLEGMKEFARETRGALWTQTMLIPGMNDQPAGLERVGDFLAELTPARAFLSTPTRPPAESIGMPTDEQVNAAWFTIASRFPKIEIVPKAEDAFVRTGNPELDLLASLSVHPMLEHVVARDDDAAAMLHRLMRDGAVQRVSYGGRSWLTRTKGVS